MRNRPIPASGFTLVEMMLVASMLAVIAAAIFATFANGIRIWERANTTIAAEDVNIFFDRFATDIKNSLDIEGMSFTGEEESLRFPTIVESARLGRRTVGEAVYFYDDGMIKKETRDFSHIYTGDDGAVRESLRGVESLRFLYYFYDEEKREYFWEEVWGEEMTHPPMAVRLTIGLMEDGDIIEFTKTVDIPARGGE
jgi:prepilin-type N-terminal cleavage/methylation domain-containing protein